LADTVSPFGKAKVNGFRLLARTYWRIVSSDA